MVTVQTRLDQRWWSEVAEVRSLAGRSDGRLRLLTATIARVQVEMSCISAFRQGAQEPTVAHAAHRIALLRLDTWPASPVQAVHEHPSGVFHPNIAPEFDGGASPTDQIANVQRLLGLFCAGAICYGQASPSTRLVDVIGQIYNMIGFRFQAFARSGEHLNIEAGRWAQGMMRDNRLPLEKRPLVAIGGSL